MATIKEIANRARVSMTTVSRVLNYDETLSITDAKKKLIFEIAEELNYKTPRNRKKNTKKNFKLGILHSLSIQEELENPYYISVKFGIEEKCSEENIEIVNMYNGDISYDFKELKKFNGLIIIGNFFNKYIKKILKNCKNIVFIDSSPLEDKCDSVRINFEKAVVNVLDYFVEKKGYRSIAYIGGEELFYEYNTPLGKTRNIAFIEYMEKKGIFNEKYNLIGKFSYQDGYRLAKEVLKNNVCPEAFFIANDDMAIGAMKAIYEAGLKIPEDVSIIGFNDIPAAKYTFPPLSTVKIFSKFMGETAAQLSIERIKGRDISKKVIIPTKLILRGTTK